MQIKEHVQRIAHKNTILGLSYSVQHGLLDQSDFVTLSLSVSKLDDRCEINMMRTSHGVSVGCCLRAIGGSRPPDPKCLPAQLNAANGGETSMASLVIEGTQRITCTC